MKKVLVIGLIFGLLILSGCPFPPAEDECQTAADCEGLTHIECEGEWTCVEGECAWTCAQEPQCADIGETPMVCCPELECCEGLEAVDEKMPDPDNTEECLDMGFEVCLPVGDDVCGMSENRCNSPEDCADQPACTKEGEIAGALECCEGLEAVADGIPDPDNLAVCKYMMHAICLPVGDGVCGEYEDWCTSRDDCAGNKKCGNGVCEPQYDETIENCAADCKETCEEGESMGYECPDGTEVPWCFCEDGNWVCITSPENNCPANLEVYEWGVIVACSEDDNAFVTSRPKQIFMVEKPVIYFHADKEVEVWLDVEFANGDPYTTYPEAEVEGSKVKWYGVWVDPYCAQWEMDIEGVYDDLYWSLEDIIPILNDVDSACVEYGGQQENFLFYEGEMTFQNSVVASFDTNAWLVTLKNENDFDVYNVTYAVVVGYDEEYGYIPIIEYANLDVLEAGEEVTAELSESLDIDLFKNDLVALGFSESEAESFDNLWNENFTYTEEAVLGYRLPQEQYDEMLPIVVDPNPSEIVRAMYVLIDFSR